jgi:hypothetical protein
MSAMRLREVAADAGWLVAIVLLLPLAIPLGVLAAVVLLGERLSRKRRRRMRGAALRVSG